MNQDELARAVAAELDPTIAIEVEREIKGEPPPGGATRAFGVSEVMASAGFLYQCAISAKRTASTDVACGSGIIDAFGLAELVDASGFGTTA